MAKEFYQTKEYKKWEGDCPCHRCPLACKGPCEGYSTWLSNQPVKPTPNHKTKGPPSQRGCGDKKCITCNESCEGLV